MDSNANTIDIMIKREWFKILDSFVCPKLNLSDAFPLFISLQYHQI